MSQPSRSIVAAARSSTLPRPLTPLIGREAEIVEVCARFKDGARLVTLTGPGGVGKTRIALAIAEQLQDIYPDGATFVSLAPIANYHRVISAIARHLGILEELDQPILSRLTDHLRDREMLLVLDNLEHVISVADSLAELLRSCHRLVMLATSREPMHLAGEREYAVEPLPLLAIDAHQPFVALSANDAVRLFVERASSASLRFVLSDTNAPEINAICHRVGGLPLAIELAAARMKALSPADLLTRLDASSDVSPLWMLAGGPRDAPTRQQTMRDTIYWSYELLTPEEQQAFRQFSVFAGGWTIDAAVSVAAQADVLNLLSSLIDKSLVQRVDAVGRKGRYSMLEPIRQFALEQLTEAEEEAPVRQRHAEYLLGLVEHIEDDLDSPDAGRIYDEIEAEQDNMRGALRWLRNTGQVELGLQLSGNLGRFWNPRGYGIEGLAYLDVFLGPPGADRRTIGRALALTAMSWMSSVYEGVDRSVPAGIEACEIFEEHGDIRNLGRALVGLGLARLHGGDVDGARADFERALPLLRDSGLTAYVVRVLLHLGEIAYRAGDIAQVRTLADEALALARAGRHQQVTALSLGFVGAVCGQLGNLDAAAAHYRERISIYYDLGFPWHIAHTIEQFADIAFQRNDRERAARLLGAAGTLREQTGTSGTQTSEIGSGKAIDALREWQLDETLRAAWHEGRAFSLDEAVAYAAEDASVQSPAIAASPVLTRRELDVVKLLTDGKSNQEIAQVLFISPNTVTTHVANIMNKLGLESRTAVATWAVREGIV